ncbi:unnamed protein product [Citrullus colocynthis]|uniref:Uncharacterized protein n=1 Tax=Citrullus colocynthis TaxID=252529 RepID=A0ABP0Y4B0_9ROSI
MTKTYNKSIKGRSLLQTEFVRAAIWTPLKNCTTSSVYSISSSPPESRASAIFFGGLSAPVRIPFECDESILVFSGCNCCELAELGFD